MESGRGSGQWVALGEPVIIAADGQVLDGMHRIAKALLMGNATVQAQRLLEDPEPDWLREA